MQPQGPLSFSAAYLPLYLLQSRQNSVISNLIPLLSPRNPQTEIEIPSPLFTLPCSMYLAILFLCVLRYMLLFLSRRDSFSQFLLWVFLIGFGYFALKVRVWWDSCIWLWVSWCLDDGSNVFDMGFLYLIMVLTYWTMDLIMMVLNNLIVLLILVFWFQD